MSMSRLDQLYRSLLLTKFFTHGWGKPDNLKRLFEFRKILSNRETCQQLVSVDYPINIDKEYKDGDCRILEGHFLSPFVHHLPGIMPKEVETASFQMILPIQWRDPVLKPICIHLAGTGDHYFWRRRILTARPLLKEAGIASILLENPYYGTRKPKQQLRSSLRNVSDLFVMGGALVLESLALLHWCEREGLGPLGLSGVSMGGHMASGAATLWPKPISLIPILSWTTASISFTQMASLAATNWTKPISLIPCLSWSTASCVFTQGVMSGAIPWKTLQEQFFENSVYQDEIRKFIISPEDDHRRAYDMGQEFVKDYSHSIEQVESIHRQHEQERMQTTTNVESGVNRHHSTDAKSNDGSATLVIPPPTPAMGFSTNCDRSGTNDMNSNNPDSGLKDGISVVPNLTQQEYVDRVNAQERLCDEEHQSVPTFSPDNGLTEKESILSVGSSNAVSSTSSSVPLPFSSSSSSQSSSSSSSSSAVLSSSEIRLSRKLKKDSSNLALSYAKAKQSQQSKASVPCDSRTTLSLRHALAKSKLMISRQPASPLPSNEEQMKSLQHEALDFMRGVMDECTHLGNFSVPVDPGLIIIIAAKQDAYVPRDGVLGLDQLWPGCEVRYIDQGHVGAVLWHQSVFRKAIKDAFDRQIKKYYQNPGNEPSHHQPVRTEQLVIKS